MMATDEPHAVLAAARLRGTVLNLRARDLIG